MSILNKIKKNNTLIKHSGAIHITNKLTLIDRKVINVLLKNAYDDLGKKDSYKISISELGKAIGWDGNKSLKKIKDCLTKLNTTAMQGNIFGKDKKSDKDTWTTVTFLSSADLKSNEGYCKYRYDRFNRPLRYK